MVMVETQDPAVPENGNSSTSYSGARSSYKGTTGDQGQNPRVNTA